MGFCGLLEGNYSSQMHTNDMGSPLNFNVAIEKRLRMDTAFGRGMLCRFKINIQFTAL